MFLWLSSKLAACRIDKPCIVNSRTLALHTESDSFFIEFTEVEVNSKPTWYVYKMSPELLNWCNPMTNSAVQTCNFFSLSLLLHPPPPEHPFASSLQTIKWRLEFQCFKMWDLSLCTFLILLVWVPWNLLTYSCEYVICPSVFYEIKYVSKAFLAKQKCTFYYFHRPWKAH